MAHPRMFDDDDPMLARVRALALALPGAQEKISHGRPAFFTVKIHCLYGGSVRTDGEWIAHDQSVLLHLPPAGADHPARGSRLTLTRRQAGRWSP